MGVGSVAELERMPTDSFVQIVIKMMHLAVEPPSLREAMEKAEFHVKANEPSEDGYAVKVEVALTVSGRTKTADVVFLAKRDGSVWKYNGDATMQQRASKYLPKTDPAR